jgi:hypothetical protein
MKKLRLDLEEIAVETFETATARPEKGTVLGHGRYTDAIEADTCQASCNLMCYSIEECPPEEESSSVFTAQVYC